MAQSERAEPRGRAGATRPWVSTNMVVSLDGAVSVDGRSGPLGSPADRALFEALRAAHDTVLVGAGTVRAERYRLRADGPRIAVVSRSATFPADLELFAPNRRVGAGDDPSARHEPTRPLLYTTDAGATVAEARGLGADVVSTGVDDVDLRAVLDDLARRGARRVLCEGGPELLSTLAAGDLVDEWNVSVSPLLAGGTTRMLTHDIEPRPVALVRVCESDGMLFLRYHRP